MASVVGEREIDLSKLSIEQLNQLKTQLGEVREEERGKGGGREGGKEGREASFSAVSTPNGTCVHSRALHVDFFPFTCAHAFLQVVIPVRPPPPCLPTLTPSPPSLPPSSSF